MKCKTCAEYGSAFCKECQREEVAANAVAQGGVDMNPDGKAREYRAYDKRYRKDKPPVILKRFKSMVDGK